MIRRGLSQQGAWLVSRERVGEGFCSWQVGEVEEHEAKSADHLKYQKGASWGLGWVCMFMGFVQHAFVCFAPTSSRQVCSFGGQPATFRAHPAAL